MRSPKHQKTRELWCASHFPLGFEQHFGPIQIDISDRDAQEISDMTLIYKDAHFPFQITLALEKGRKMGDDYKNFNEDSEDVGLVSWGKNTKQVSDWVRSAINKKAKRYRSLSIDIHLLVYVNVPAYEHDYAKIRATSADISANFASVWCINGEGLCCIKENSLLPECRAWKRIPSRLLP